MNQTTTVFYRPVGPKELALIAASGFREFPPRLPAQPFFYPVLNQDYASNIARKWNVKDSGAGFVTRFRVRREFASKYPVQTVGGSTCQELWVPAVELAAFNANIVGLIEAIAEFTPEDSGTPSRERVETGVNPEIDGPPPSVGGEGVGVTVYASHLSIPARSADRGLRCFRAGPQRTQGAAHRARP